MSFPPERVPCESDPHRPDADENLVDARRTELAHLESQVAAIRRSQAVITFDLDGTVLDANDNFLTTLGYQLGEVRGRHHRMFVDPEEARSPAYEEFWQTLRRGEFLASRFRRIGKGGREVWIEATYNPILDADQRPYQVVKFATDVTPQVRLLQDLKALIDENFREIDLAVERVAEQSAQAALQAGHTASNVESVATGAHQLAASVAEIAQSMSSSRRSADAAHGHTANGSDATQRLLVAATSIGGIVGVIQTIASQINLLALNAAIEAARAGDAGRGFAVVANEVKTLAKQAAEATVRISEEIDDVRQVSSEVAQALTGIGAAMDSVLESVASTASAVEEQSAVTRSMSASMDDASGAMSHISGNIGQISSAVDQVASVVSRTRHAAEVLAR